jgi:type II secretory pathway pseudopilin PulG
MISSRMVRELRSLPSGRNETGFTLVELIVYAVLMVVVLAVVGAILINSSRAERSVRSASEAAAVGQVIAQSVERGVRNASALTLVNDASGGGQLLLARTAGTDSALTWRCQAWYFSPTDDGAVYTTTAATVIALPTGGPKGVWSLLGGGVSATTGAGVFAAPAGRVEVGLKVAASGQPAVHIQTTAVQRQAGLESAPCF